MWLLLCMMRREEGMVKFEDKREKIDKIRLDVKQDIITDNTR